MKKLIIFFVVLTFSITQSPLFSMSFRPSKTYEQYRKDIAHEALAKRFRIPIPSNFWIDACCSGGGYRAMVATTGFVAGLTEIGLFDSIRNIACLSGSTWMMGSFMAKDKSIDDFATILKDRITNLNFYDNYIPTLNRIAKNMETRFSEGRNVQLVDLYGGLVADRLMGDLGASSQDICFGDFANKTTAVRYPHPIFTAIHPHLEPTCCCCRCFATPSYEWIEITPDKTRQIFSDNSIPTNNLGLPLRCAPTENPLLPLSTIMGICGSAFALNAHELIGFLKDKLVARVKEKRDRAYDAEKLILNELLSSLTAGRFSPAKVPNFTDCDDENIELVDAGIHLNLPLIPLLERYTPMIIVCDADASPETYAGNYPQLRKAAEWATEKHIPFPSMNFPDEKNPHFRVFKRDAEGKIDPTLPTILYFHNSVEKDTFEFNYTPEEFDSIFKTMRTAMLMSGQDIEQEIREKIAFLSQ